MPVAVLSVLLAIQVLSAQSRHKQGRAEQLLQSPSIESRAWGVFYAGRLGSPALKQRLVDQLVALIPYRDADPVVARGPRDVYYRRTVAPTDAQVGWSVSSRSWSAQQERIAYLAALTQSETPQLRHLMSRVSGVPWRGNTDIERKVDLLLEQQANDIRSWLGDAVRLGVADGRSDRLGITVNIEDKRRGASGSGSRVIQYFSVP